MSHAGLYVTENGRVQAVLHKQARRRGLRRATKSEVEASGIPTKPCGCGGRGRPAPPPPIVQWLGIEWIGEPFPKRIRFRSPIYVVPHRGCGCIRRLKWWATQIKTAIDRRSGTADRQD